MKLSKHKLPTIAILFCLLLLSTNLIATEIEFQNNSGLDIAILGYEGFNKYELLDITSEQNQIITYCIEYKGLAILRFPTGQSYPVYFDTTAFQIIVNDPNSPPEFINSPDNEWLYNWLRTKNPEELNTNQFIGIKVLIKARLLNESTYVLKTKEELQSKKEEYKKFLKPNIHYLFNSDMLIQLCRQYLMMNEYVVHSKMEFQDQVNEDVDNWIDMVSGYIKPDEAVRFILEIFYGRSMVAIAGSILDCNTEILLNNHIESQFKPDGKFPDLNVHTADSEYGWKLSQNNGEKIISVVGEEDVIAKVSTIINAREMEDNNLQIPIIIIPIDTLSSSHYVMDRMFTGTLYFAEKNKTLTGLNSPLFILLDDKNVIVNIGRNRNDILNH